MKYSIMSRCDDTSIVTIECNESLSKREKLRAAIIAAKNQEISLEDAYLPHADLSDMSLNNMSFKNAVLHNADLSHCSLHRTIFSNAILEGANLTSTDLHCADFTDAYLNDAIFTDAKFNKANFAGGNLCDAIDAPVCIQWLDYTAYVFKDRAEIGCQIIRRDAITEYRENALSCHRGLFCRYESILKEIWETAFPLKKTDEII